MPILKLVCPIAALYRAQHGIEPARSVKSESGSTTESTEAELRATQLERESACPGATYYDRWLADSASSVRKKRKTLVFNGIVDNLMVHAARAGYDTKGEAFELFVRDTCEEYDIWYKGHREKDREPIPDGQSPLLKGVNFEGLPRVAGYGPQSRPVKKITPTKKPFCGKPASSRTHLRRHTQPGPSAVSPVSNPLDIHLDVMGLDDHTPPALKGPVDNVASHRSDDISAFNFTQFLHRQRIIELSDASNTAARAGIPQRAQFSCELTSLIMPQKEKQPIAWIIRRLITEREKEANDDMGDGSRTQNFVIKPSRVLSAPRGSYQFASKDLMTLGPARITVNNIVGLRGNITRETGVVVEMSELGIIEELVRGLIGVANMLETITTTDVFQSADTMLGEAINQCKRDTILKLIELLILVVRIRRRGCMMARQFRSETVQAMKQTVLQGSSLIVPPASPQ